MINYLISSLTIAGIFLIAVFGLYILTGLTGQISIAQASYMGVGAVLSSYFARSTTANYGELAGLGMPFLPSMLLASIIVAVLSSMGCLVFIRLKGSASISASLASVVLISYAIERLSFLSGGPKGTSSSSTLYIGPIDFSQLSFGSNGLDKDTGLLLVVILCAIMCYVLTWNVARSPLGRSMRTVRERSSTAQTCSIPSTRVIIYSYFIAGFFAGVSGSLYAHFLKSFSMTSTNLWFGPFSIVLSMQLLAYLVISGMKRLPVVTLVVFFLSFMSYFFSKISDRISFLNTASGGLISPSQISAIISSAVVLGLIVYSSRSKDIKT